MKSRRIALNCIAMEGEVELLKTIDWLNIVKAGNVPASLKIIISIIRETMQLRTRRILRLSMIISKHLPVIFDYICNITGRTTRRAQFYTTLVGFTNTFTSGNVSEWATIANANLSPILTLLEVLNERVLQIIDDVTKNVVIAWECIRNKSNDGKYFTDETMMNCYIQLAQLVAKSDTVSSEYCKDYLQEMAGFFASKAVETLPIMKKLKVLPVDISTLTQRGEWAKQFMAPKTAFDPECIANESPAAFQWLAGSVTSVGGGPRAWLSSFYANGNVLFAKWYGPMIVPSMNQSFNGISFDSKVSESTRASLYLLKNIDMTTCPELVAHRNQTVETAEKIVNQLDGIDRDETKNGYIPFKYTQMGAELLASLLNGADFDYSKLQELSVFVTGYGVLTGGVLASVADMMISQETQTIFAYIVTQKKKDVVELLGAGTNGDTDDDDEVAELKPLPTEQQVLNQEPVELDDELHAVVGHLTESEQESVIGRMKEERARVDAEDLQIIDSGDFNAIRDRLETVQNTLLAKTKIWKENEMAAHEEMEQGLITIRTVIAKDTEGKLPPSLRAAMVHVAYSEEIPANQSTITSKMLRLQAGIPWLEFRLARLLKALHDIRDAETTKIKERKDILEYRRMVLFAIVFSVVGLGVFFGLVLGQEHIMAIASYLGSTMVGTAARDTASLVFGKIMNSVELAFAKDPFSNLVPLIEPFVPFDNTTILERLDPTSLPMFSTVAERSFAYTGAQNVIYETVASGVSAAIDGVTSVAASSSTMAAGGAAALASAGSTVLGAVGGFVTAGINMTQIPERTGRYLNIMNANYVHACHYGTYLLEDAANTVVITQIAGSIVYETLDKIFNRHLISEIEKSPSFTQIFRNWMLVSVKPAAILMSICLITTLSRKIIQTAVTVTLGSALLSPFLNANTAIPILIAAVTTFPSLAERLLQTVYKWTGIRPALTSVNILESPPVAIDVIQRGQELLKITRMPSTIHARNLLEIMLPSSLTPRKTLGAALVPSFTLSDNVLREKILRLNDTEKTLLISYFTKPDGQPIEPATVAAIEDVNISNPPEETEYEKLRSVARQRVLFRRREDAKRKLRESKSTDEQ